MGKKDSENIKKVVKILDLPKKIRTDKKTKHNISNKKATILLKIIKSRRSIRFFKRTPIPEEDLMMILEGARWAPSPANSQPWEFIIVRDQKIKEDLMNTMKKVGTRIKRRYVNFPWGTTSRDPEMISKVSVVVIVCANPNRRGLKKYDIFPSQHKQEIIKSCIGAAIQNMMLIASALGIGSLWISPFSTTEIKKILKIPKSVQLMAIIPLGYPAKDFSRQISRYPLETLVHYERMR